ncbi:MAG: TPM domain-containing protein, partial [Nitrospiraceae bacterium]|nr:TPM domain-containing protein [Nitrospiraceae bacterium]
MIGFQFTRQGLRGFASLGLIVLLSVVDASASLYERPKERVPLPNPIGYVSDHAHVVEGEWKERIRSVCTDLEKKSGVEMVIVTVPSIKPYPSAKEYADALYAKWQIGSTQQEHGLMVLVAVQERQAAMTLGRQMLPAVTPEIRHEVSRQYLQPAIERGHFGEGLYRTAVALATPAQEVRLETPSR